MHVVISLMCHRKSGAGVLPPATPYKFQQSLTSSSKALLAPTKPY